jgi:uracil-DNA glycosylase family 4
MIEFKRHSECDKCLLCQSAKNSGLPTRALTQTLGPTKERAVLFVGQSPGHNEDVQACSFVGFSGKLVEGMCKASKLSIYADIYLANACRCKPPQGANESQSQIRACREYLVEDVAILQQYYKEVIIFALGAKACYSTLNISSLNETLKKQGNYSPVLGKVRVFATFHPAMLAPHRKPGLIRAVETHFSLLIRYLQGRFIPNSIEVTPEVCGGIPTKTPAEVTLDIETYGILSGQEQTVFHPIKSKEIDGIDFINQVKTVGFGWRENGKKLRTPLYLFKYKSHRNRIRRWLRFISLNNILCVGQNIKFDLLYLRYCGDAEIPYWIDPRRLRVDDTLIMSFLLFEQQPEKGLKELSTLFGIADYSTSEVTGKHGNAKSIHDPKLHYYQSLDNAATLILYEELKRRILEKYGPNSPKLSPLSAWCRNMIVWDCVDLEANGSALKIPELQKFHDKEIDNCKKLREVSEKFTGIKLAGTGSDAPLRQLMMDCATELQIGDKIEWTKTGNISIGIENVNLVKSEVKKQKLFKSRSLNIKTISLLHQYKKRSKITSTYTGPLLNTPRKGIVTRNGDIGIVYPSWYPVPLYASRGGSSDDKSGGQIQGRFSCKGPARQTEPKSIRKASRSRWPNGTLVECDMAADHLRMAALLSGDPILLEVYNDETKSLHHETALTIFPDEPRDESPEAFKEREPDKYKLGKTLNFLMIFRGGPEAFQRTALQDCGIEIGLHFCRNAIDSWFKKYNVYKQWQDRMIRLAADKGYLEIPTGWSRTFGRGMANIEGQVGEVLNFLHQAPCAQLTQSCHYKIKHEFLNKDYKSLIVLNIYDALFKDSPAEEEEATTKILFDTMNNPPLLPIFEQWTEHKVKWAAELKRYK